MGSVSASKMSTLMQRAMAVSGGVQIVRIGLMASVNVWQGTTGMLQECAIRLVGCLRKGLKVNVSVLLGIIRECWDHVCPLLAHLVTNGTLKEGSAVLCAHQVRSKFTEFANV